MRVHAVHVALGRRPVSCAVPYRQQVAQCDEEGKILNIYPSFKEAARAVNGTSSAISRVCSGTNIRHKGYKWKLVEEIVQEDI